MRRHEQRPNTPTLQSSRERGHTPSAEEDPRAAIRAPRIGVLPTELGERGAHPDAPKGAPGASRDPRLEEQRWRRTPISLECEGKPDVHPRGPAPAQGPDVLVEDVRLSEDRDGVREGTAGLEPRYRNVAVHDAGGTDGRRGPRRDRWDRVRRERPCTRPRVCAPPLSAADPYRAVPQLTRDGPVHGGDSVEDRLQIVLPRARETRAIAPLRRSSGSRTAT